MACSVLIKVAQPFFVGIWRCG
ncbi:hypothetical protein GBAR_LOCUS5596 [Geodia barretti]|uniref:Uncharacterized protein n=1 Tax=Geodia barretti TaxID=519541 RepID=A0AA35RBU8_GEOBA|nr:hypothetical protein GBAR_LOCUS5596 [Geodia barretti]